jgi:hypothetical protein
MAPTRSVDRGTRTKIVAADGCGDVAKRGPIGNLGRRGPVCTSVGVADLAAGRCPMHKQL